MSVLAIEGELTIYRALQLKAELLAALAGGSELELDLSQVTEMDSAGVQLLLVALREASSAGKPLRVTGRSQAVAEVLHLCGLDAFAAVH